MSINKMMSKILISGICSLKQVNTMRFEHKYVLFACLLKNYAISLNNSRTNHETSLGH